MRSSRDDSNTQKSAGKVLINKWSLAMADNDEQSVRRRNVEPQSESDNDRLDVNKQFIIYFFVVRRRKNYFTKDSVTDIRHSLCVKDV